jgi:hypothetical protein
VDPVYFLALRANYVTHTSSDNCLPILTLCTAQKEFPYLYSYPRVNSRGLNLMKHPIDLDHSDRKPIPIDTIPIRSLLYVPFKRILIIGFMGTIREYCVILPS